MSYSTISSASLRRDNTGAAKQAAAQFNAKYASPFYTRLADIANNGQYASQYIQVYSPGAERDNADLAIRDGEIVLALRPSKSKLVMANRTLEGTPVVFTSLNGFMVDLESATVEGWPAGAQDTKDNRRTNWAMLERIMRKQLMVMGVSMKNVPYPMPGGVHDDPVVQISGVTTMVNTGDRNLAVGDLVAARFPGWDSQGLAIMPSRTNLPGQGISKTKRIMITDKFDDPKYSRAAATAYLKTSSVAELERPTVPVMFPFQPKTPLEDVCAKLFDLLDVAWQLGATNAPVPMKDEVTGAAAVGMTKQQVLRALISGTNKRLEFTAPLILDSTGVETKLGGLGPRVLMAVHVNYAEDMSFVLGRALMSATPGDNFDILLGTSSL